MMTAPPLTGPALQQFRLLPQHMRIEYLRSLWDWPTFARQSLSIPNLDGDVVPFKVYPSQMRLWNTRQACDKEIGYSRIVVLKGRRVFVSAATAAQIFHRTPWMPNRHAAVFANVERNTQEIFQYYKNFHRSYKPFGPEGMQLALPGLVSDKSEMLRYDNGSWIQCITGGSAQSVDSVRGMGLWAVHVSEAPYIDALPKLLNAADNALNKRPGSLLIVEGTAKQAGDEFHQLVLRAQSKRSPWRLMFFGWHEHPLNVLQISQSPAAYERGMSQEEQEIRLQYGLSLEQIEWRRATIEGECRGDLESFYREYPMSVDQAFRYAGRPRFVAAHIDRQPVQESPAMRGDLVIVQQRMREVVQFKVDPKGYLDIYQMPVKGRRYAIGADASQGKDPGALAKSNSDPDYSVACVLDCDTGMQVAQFRARMTPLQFGYMAFNLGRFYNWAYLVPERNSMGLGLVERLLELEYPHLHMEERKPGDFTTTDPHRVGWETTKATKPVLLQAIEDALETGEVQVFDAVTAAELRAFQLQPDGKAEAAKGSHDDCVIALGLAIIGKHHAPRVLKFAPEMGQEYSYTVEKLPIRSASFVGSRPMSDEQMEFERSRSAMFGRVTR